MIARPIPSPLAQEQQQQYYYPDLFYMPFSATAAIPDSYDTHSEKRVKLDQSALPFFAQTTVGLDSPSSFIPSLGGNMQQGQLRGLNPPHINLQRASESASPATVATTLSHSSTPSRSPSRVSIISDSVPSDWLLMEEQPLGTLVQDHPKDTVPSTQPQPSTTSTTQPQIPSYPTQMETALHNDFYSSYHTDYSKLSHQQYLTPYTQTYPPLSQAHSNEDDLPALSPSNRYSSSGHPSVYEGDIHSPMTSIGSPGSNDGDRVPSARTPVTREDTYIPILDDWMDESLHFPFMIDIQNQAPKFTRTVSDAVEDELFRSSSTMEMPKVQQQQQQQPQQQQPQQQQQKQPRQRPNNISTLATYYQKAQNDHAMEARQPTPTVSRGESPFRVNSPFHTLRPPQTAPVRHSNFHPYLTFQSRREHQKDLETQSMAENMMAEVDQIIETPKTISPKDAMLEYPDPEDEASRTSLFAHEQNYTNGGGHIQSGYNMTDDMSDRGYTGLNTSRRGSDTESIHSSSAFSFHQSPHIPILPSSYPYHQPTLPSATVPAPRMASNSEQAKSASPLIKPEGSKADTGAYTCTAQGCNQRFPTSQKLQKHKRENHRQSTPVGSAGMTSTLHGQLPSRHQGPHRCMRTNPTTGKPCNTLFSRPYDLTRHEDTIHNTTREKVRCEICNDDKRFSRQDALTRHKKVKHGIDK
ncbi:hypothetical protein BDZ91DRAFT_801471 [Kalaharituber pfeilii]|nr:hypothetical protein BDZ91DRAFT_801471 [Kalaharituber pfeilii]